MAQDNQIILRVALDEGKTLEQLQGLVSEIEKTKKAQADLVAAKKAGSITEEEYNKQVVELRTQLRGQQQEQTALQKNLDAYRSAMARATGSVDQLKAQSALLTAQYNALSEEQRENTEAGRELTAQLDEVNKALLAAGTQVNDNRRNVGNYSAGLRDAVKESGFFGGITAKVTEAQENFSKAQGIAKAAIGGNVTALGLLRLALLATGLGALVVVLGSVVAFLTKTQAGTDLVSRKFAGLKAILSLVVGEAAAFGETLFKAAENPKQALSDLVDFIEENLLNRFKALKIIFDGLTTGGVAGFNKVTEGVFQLSTGIADADKKLAAFTARAYDAAKAGESIEAENQRILRAERALNVERSQSRAQIEGLKKLSDDTTKSVATRTLAAKEAAAIENGLLAQQLKLQDAKIRNTLREANLDKQLTNDELDAIAELRSARADTQQESLTLQTELQNKINSLVQEGYDKSIAGRAQALALEKALLDKQLAQVQVNSDEELRIRQQLLTNGRAAELNVKNLTVAQKKAIDVKYEADSLALSLDFNRRRLQAALQAEADLTTARLAQQTDTGANLLALQAQQIEEQRQQALTGLTANADNTAKIAAINAQAAQQQRQLEFEQATRDLQTYLDDKRDAIELDYAKGVIQEGEYQRRLAAVTKAGTDAQAVINSDYRQSNAENARQAAQNEIEAERRHTAEVKRTEEVKQEIKEATIGAAQAATDTIIQLYGEESGAGVAALAIKKTLGLAEIALNLQKELSANKVAGAQIAQYIPPPAGPILATAYIIAKDALSIAAAAAGAASILKLQRGGIADGPSHEQGGIHLYRQGRATGIEIEGGEPVLTKGVSQNPLLLSLASTVNQLAGGRALGPNLSVPRMALGGVAPTLLLDQLRGGAGEVINYERLGEATAKALRKSPPITRISDVQAGFDRAAETQRLSNG
jgi:hypothetical protein